MQTVAETPLFARRAEALLSEAERFDLITLLATEPTAGDVIKGTGGVRKLRFRAAGRGKSGGVGSADQLKAVASIAIKIIAKR